MATLSRLKPITDLFERRRKSRFVSPIAKAPALRQPRKSFGKRVRNQFDSGVNNSVSNRFFRNNDSLTALQRGDFFERAKIENPKTFSQSLQNASLDLGNLFVNTPAQFGQQFSQDISDLNRVRKGDLSSQPDFRTREQVLKDTGQQAKRGVSMLASVSGLKAPKLVAGVAGFTGGANTLLGRDKSRSAGQQFAQETIEALPRALPSAGVLRVTSPRIDAITGGLAARTGLKGAANVAEGLAIDQAAGFETTGTSIAIDALFPAGLELGGAARNKLKSVPKSIADAVKKSDSSVNVSGAKVVGRVGDVVGLLTKDGRKIAYDTKAKRITEVPKVQKQKTREITGSIMGKPVAPIKIRETVTEPAFGAVAGLEFDDEGNIKIDRGRALAGVALAGGLKKVDSKALDELSGTYIGKPTKAAKTIGETKKELYQDLFRATQPIDDLVKSFEETGKVRLRPQNNPVFAIRQLWGVGGRAEFIKTFEFDKIMEPVKDVKGDHFSLYLMARRTLDSLSKRDIETGMSTAKAKEVIDMVEGTYGKDRIRQTADALYSFQLNQLSRLRDAGFLDDTAFENITKANKSYVPFQRLMDDLEEAPAFAKKSMQQSKNPIVKIKGSDRKVLPVMESIVQNIYKTEVAIAKNRVAKQVAELGQVLSDEIRPLKTAGAAGKPKITVWENGTKQYYQVPEDIEQVMKNLSPSNSGVVMKLLGAGANVLRTTATSLNPDFMLPNIVRDNLDASTLNSIGYTPLDFFRGLSEVYNAKRGKPSKIYEEWAKGGGKIYFDSEAFERTVDDLAKQQINKKASVRGLRAIRDFLDTLGDYSETPTRLGAFKKARAKGLSVEQAVMESRNISLDFADGGNKIKQANRILPFLNVQFLALDRLSKYIRDPAKRGKAIKRAVVIGGVPTVALNFYNRSVHGDLIDLIPEWEREGNFIFITGQDEDGKVQYKKVPKGHISKLVANPMDSLLDAMYREDLTYYQALGSAVWNAIADVTPVLEEDPSKTLGGAIPQTLKPAVQNVANYDFFRGQEIVPSYLQGGNRQNFEKTKSNTERVYNYVGQVLDVSPLMVKSFYESTFGGLGKLPVNVVEVLGDLASGEKPSKDDLPVLRRFINETIPESTIRQMRGRDKTQKAKKAYLDSQKPDFLSRLFNIKDVSAASNADLTKKDANNANVAFGYDTYLQDRPTNRLEAEKYDGEVLSDAFGVYRDDEIPEQLKPQLIEAMGLEYKYEEVVLGAVSGMDVIDRAIWIEETLKKLPQEQRMPFLRALESQKTITGKRILTNSVKEKLFGSTSTGGSRSGRSKKKKSTFKLSDIRPSSLGKVTSSIGKVAQFDIPELKV